MTAYADDNTTVDRSDAEARERAAKRRDLAALNDSMNDLERQADASKDAIVDLQRRIAELQEIRTSMVKSSARWRENIVDVDRLKRKGIDGWRGTTRDEANGYVSEYSSKMSDMAGVMAGDIDAVGARISELEAEEQRCSRQRSDMLQAIRDLEARSKAIRESLEKM